MPLQDVNPYNEDKFRQKFIETDLYKTIQKDFDCLLWASFPEVFDGGTGRQYHGDKNLLKTKFSLVPFYYLEFLTEKHPTKIYDLGCGWNIFKKYIPTVIGVGAEPPGSEWYFADIHDFVDADYVNGHQNYFESVFAICSLHFHPISKLRQIILDFASMVKPSGRGFIALNAMRMLDLDPEMFNHPNLELWIRQELSDLPFQVLQFEVDLSELDNGMDGNIRLVLEK